MALSPRGQGLIEGALPQSAGSKPCEAVSSRSRDQGTPALKRMAGFCLCSRLKRALFRQASVQAGLLFKPLRHF